MLINVIHNLLLSCTLNCDKIKLLCISAKIKIIIFCLFLKRLQELSETVGTYDRLRQQDQQGKKMVFFREINIKIHIFLFLKLCKNSKNGFHNLIKKTNL